MMSNLCTHWGGGPFPPPKKNKIWGAKIFSNPLGSGAWSKIFLAIVAEKKYRKLVSKFWGLPPKKFAGVKINFAIFRLFSPFLQNNVRYRQSKNGFVIYGHSATRWWRNGVLLSSMNYVILTRKHPPSDLIASLYTKRLARGAVGGGIPIRRSSVEIISSLWIKCTRFDFLPDPLPPCQCHHSLLDFMNQTLKSDGR